MKSAVLTFFWRRVSIQTEDFIQIGRHLDRIRTTRTGSSSKAVVAILGWRWLVVKGKEEDSSPTWALYVDG